MLGVNFSSLPNMLIVLHVFPNREVKNLYAVAFLVNSENRDGEWFGQAYLSFKQAASFLNQILY
jgi:hypothetical protein